MRSIKLLFSLFVLFISGLSLTFAVGSGPVTIHHVYGGGGNASAPYESDFIVLHNTSGSPVDLTGWSIENASAADDPFPVNRIITLNGTIAGSGYFLVEVQTSGVIGIPLSDHKVPNQVVTTAEFAGTSGFGVSDNKFQLKDDTATVVDLLGLGSANMALVNNAIVGPLPAATASDTAPSPSGNAQSTIRTGNAGTNNSDFAIQSSGCDAPFESVCLLYADVTASAIIYDFESDTIGEAPGNITAANGTSIVVAGQAMSPQTISSGNTVSFNLDLFPEATNYSVTWKERYSTAGRNGVTLRATGSNSVNVGAKQGYLFQTSPSLGHARIYTSNPTGYTLLNDTALAAAGIGVDRWYRATVYDNTLTFEYSDNGVSFIQIAQFTNSVFSGPGSTQFTRGYGASVTGSEIDDITFINYDEVIVPIDSLAVTNISDYQIFQRDGSDQADISISGTYSGSPTAIEASFDGGAYVTIDGSPSGEMFSGVLTGVSVGQGTLAVRFVNDTDIVDDVSYVGVGDIFVVAGQSNASGRGVSNNTYSHPTLRASLFGNDDNWKELVDPTDSNVGQVDSVSSDNAGGSPWPLIATQIMADHGVPVAFVPTAKGGTTTAQWQPAVDNANPSTLYGSMNRRISAVGGNVAGVLRFQGESNANNGTSASVYQAELETIVDTLNLNFPGTRTMIGQIGHSNYAGNDTIRGAQVQTVLDNANALLGPATYDINLADEGGDTLHFRSNADMALFAQRRYAAIDKEFYNGLDGYGPIMDSIVYDSAQNLVIVSFTDDSTPVIDVDSTVTTDSFALQNNELPVGIISVSINGDTVEITPTSSLNTAQSITLSYASLNDAVDKAIYDSLGLPAQPFYAQAVTAQYTVTFQNRDATFISSGAVNHGQAAIAPADPTRDGHEFSGWDTDFSTVTGNLMVTAEYGVCSEGNFESGGICTQCEPGTYQSEPGSTSCEFCPAGTFQDSSGAISCTACPEGYTSFEGAVECTINEYTITFDSNGGTAVAPITQDFDTAVTAPADPTRTGYTFDGWDPVLPATMPSSDQTHTAEWIANEYTVTYNANGATGGTVPDPQDKVHDVNLTLATNSGDLVRTNYTFVGWNTQADGGGVDYAEGGTYTGNTPVTLYANWESNLVLFYTFDNEDAVDTTGTGNDGVISGGNCSFVDDRFGTGKALQLSPECWVSMPDDFLRGSGNFTVSMWFKTTSSGGLLGYSVADVNQIGVNHVPILSIRQDGRLYAEMWIGSSMTVVSTDPVNDDQWHQVVMTSGSNSINVYLDGVDIGSAVGAPIHLDMEKNYIGTNDSRGRTLQPNGWNFYTGLIDDVRFNDVAFTAEEIAIPKYEITYNPNGATSGTGPGTKEKLEDTPYSIESEGDLVRTGYTFVGWNTQANGLGVDYPVGTEYTTDAALDLFAQWSLNDYTVTFQNRDATFISSGSVIHGDGAIAPADPTREGHEFSGWDTDFSTVIGDLTITAEYGICSEGTFEDGGTCTQCEPGTYQSSTGSTSCELCPAGTYQAFTGATSCTACPEGYSSFEGASGCTLNEYTITFDSNGGTAVASITQEYDTAVTTPANPTREGYLFAGWTPAVPSVMPIGGGTHTAQWVRQNSSASSIGTTMTVITTTDSGNENNENDGDDRNDQGDETQDDQTDLETDENFEDTESDDSTEIDETSDTNLFVFNDEELFNPTIEDGLCYTRKPGVSVEGSATISVTEEFLKALSMLYAYDLTMFNSVDQFDPYRTLSRQEAAKFFVQFATNVLCRVENNQTIAYSDTNNADQSLLPFINLAYQLGLMKGGPDGTFRPFDTITRAEFNAVVIRMILKSYLDETSPIWYQAYDEVSQALAIMTQETGSTPVTRNDATLTLFRAYKNQVFSLQSIEYDSFVLDNRGLFVQ